MHALAYFAILFKHFRTELNKVTNTSVRVSCLRAETETQDISYVILKSLALATVFVNVLVCNTLATASVLLMGDDSIS
jgi:hypothetical protein